MTKKIPEPPSGLELSPVPSLNLAEATHFCNAEMKFPTSERWLRESANRGDLEYSIVAGRRLFSTRQLFFWACNHPNRRNPKKAGTPR